MIALIVFYLLSLLASSLFIYECWRQYVNSTKLKNYVVVKSLPFVGNLIDFVKCDNIQILDFPTTLMKRYNIDQNVEQLFIWMGPMLFMYTEHPDTYERILNCDKALKKAYMYGYIRNSKGILTSEPEKWKIHRNALNPTLGPKMVSSFGPIFNEKSRKMVDLMERQVGTNIDMHLIMFNAATDSVFHAAFDVNWSLQNSVGQTFRNGMWDVLERIQLRTNSVFMKSNFLYRLTQFYQLDEEQYTKFHRLVECVFTIKKMDLANKIVQGYDELAAVRENNTSNFLHRCLQMHNEKKFDDSDLYEEMETVLIGSIDPIALTINGIILMLAIHQEYQDRAFDEIRSVFDDVNESVSNDHLSQMKYLDLVIKEGQRHFPIAPYLAREATEDIPLNGGIVPRGAQIILNVYKTQRNPKYWGENAEAFYPDRFSPENIEKQHPYQYIPFSAGPRNCIGIRYAMTNMKIALVYLLRRYKFTTDLKMNEVVIRAGLLMRIVNKNPVRIEHR